MSCEETIMCSKLFATVALCEEQNIFSLLGLVVLSIFLVFDGGETMFLSKRRVQDVHMTSTPFSNLIFVAKFVQTD